MIQTKNFFFKKEKDPVSHKFQS